MRAGFQRTHVISNYIGYSVSTRSTLSRLRAVRGDFTPMKTHLSTLQIRSVASGRPSNHPSHVRASGGSSQRRSHRQVWLARGWWIDPIPQARFRASNLRKYGKEEPHPPRERQPEEVDDCMKCRAPEPARAPPDSEEHDPPYIS